MNSKTGLIAAAWTITLAAAFFIGRTSEPSGLDEEQESDTPSMVRSSRTTERSGPSSRRRTGGQTESGPIDDERRERVRSEIKELKNLSDPIARAQGFLDFVRDLGPEEFLDAVDAFREGGIENEQFGEYRLLLTAWAQVDPLGALDYASENTGSPFARQTILTAWVKNDTEGAIGWARENFDTEGDENRANPWLVGVIEGLAPLDSFRATALLEELPFSKERGDALAAVFAEVSSEGTDAAKRWVVGLADERLKAGAASRLAATLADENPREAAEWAASLGPDIMTGAAGEIVGRWATKDLAAARDWVASQPQDVIAAAGPKLIDRIIEQEDVGAASNWLLNFEGNPEFDNTVRSFVWNSMGKEPVMAADWIMKLTSEQDQARTFHRVLGRWMESDREGAMGYISNNPVPESIKRRAGLAVTQ